MGKVAFPSLCFVRREKAGKSSFDQILLSFVVFFRVEEKWSLVYLI